MAEVILENISKQFRRGEWAVRDFNLRARDGEFVVLVGPSGCGKTTTLRLIAGLESPTSGTIRIGDRIVNQVHPRDRNIAMVFQDFPLYPHMSVFQNVAFGLKMRKVARMEIEKRVRATAAALGMRDVLDRKPRALSGGQRQRVALGRAIVREPQCFLLDEPLSNLDARLRAALRAEIKALHLRLKTTTIYVTHDQEEAMTLGERIVVMERGIIHQIGAPMDVYRNPANRFVAGFFGTPAMNFIDGRLERAENGIEFTDGRGIRIPVPASETSALEPHIGRPAALGVRPEHFRPARESSPAHSHPIALKTTFTEMLGDHANIHAQTAGGATVVVRLKTSEPFKPDQPLAVSVNPDDLRFFEPGEFGRNLLYGARAAGNS